MRTTIEPQLPDLLAQTRLLAAGTNNGQLRVRVFVFQCREGLQQKAVALDRHQTSQRADHPRILIEAELFTRLLAWQLQGFGLLDIDGVGDRVSIGVGETALAVQQVLFDRRRHADKAPVLVDQALGLAAPVKTVVLAKPVGNTHAQRDFQPAVELQHHVHRLEAVADHHIKLLFAAELVQRPHGAQPHALERLVAELEIHRVVGLAHWLARPRAPTQKGRRDLVMLTGQCAYDLLGEVGKVMGLDVVVGLQLQNLGTLHNSPR